MTPKVRKMIRSRSGKLLPASVESGIARAAASERLVLPDPAA
jgi:hypothetical protein